MALTGSLSDLSLPDIVQTIAFNKKSGILSIKSEVGIGQIYFYDGQIIQASSPLRRERLGEHLMKKGVITRQQLEAALKVQEERGRNQRIGSILLEMGLISPELNESSIRQQTEEAFYDLVEWNIGFFRFDPKPNFKTMGVALSPDKLLLEGSRRLDENARGDFDNAASEAVSRLIALHGKNIHEILKELELMTADSEPALDDENTPHPSLSTKGILEKFLAIEHVKLVLIIGKNGSFHECANDASDLHFTLSALAGNSWGLLEGLANKLDPHDRLNHAVLHFQGSVLFLRAITEEWMLMIAANPNVSYGVLMNTYFTWRKQLYLGMGHVQSL